MRFTLTDEQRGFAQTLDALLAKADTPAVARAWAGGDHAPGLTLWRRLADLGVTGLLVPEPQGGLAATPVDLCVAFEAMGRHAVPGPWVESVAFMTRLVADLPHLGVRDEVLAGLVEGDEVITVAATPHTPRAVDADMATRTMRVDDAGLHLGEVGRQHISVDPTRRLFDLPSQRHLFEVPTAVVDAAFDLAALACAAQLLGLGEHLLEESVTYAQQRRQFGRAVGSYQAVKHALADVKIGLEFARPLVQGAAVSTTPRSVSAAKVAAGDAAWRAARTALQVHGAIGYTVEHDLSLWILKVRALVGAWGTPAWHRERIMASLHEGGLMDFALSEEQQELATTVRSLLAKRADDAWSVLCTQVGAAALAVPEEYGGAGFSLVESHIVLEELGGSLVPTPMLASVLASQALLLSGNDDACADLLPGLADGTTTCAVAWAGSDGRWSTESVPVAAGDRAQSRSRLTGEAHHVLDGVEADVLLVLASTSQGIGLFRVDPGQDAVRRERTEAMDQTLHLGRVSLEDAEGELLADGLDWLPTLRDIACVAVSALQVGAAQRCLDMTVAYTQEREQFGRPIGSFQALKHRMADMFVRVETARSASWAAAWSAAQRDDDLPVRAATAKAWCTDTLDHVAAETMQLHGGIAITWEHDAQRYFKRAHALGRLFGQPHEHRRRLAEGWLP